MISSKFSSHVIFFSHFITATRRGLSNVTGNIFQETSNMSPIASIAFWKSPVICSKAVRNIFPKLCPCNSPHSNLNPNNSLRSC